MNELKIGEYTLYIKSVSPLAPKAVELQYKRKFPEPQAPTYEFEAAGGITEVLTHTLDTIETTEEKEAYLAWQEAHDAWMSGLTYKIMRLFLSQGVELKLTKAQLENFKVLADMLELEIPTSTTEATLFYLETFIIDSPDKVKTVIDAVLEATGIKEESLEAANALFQP